MATKAHTSKGIVLALSCAALLPPAALSLLAVTFAEGAERNRALGIYGAVTGISASVGVIASGPLTDGPGWRWVFFINAWPGD